MQSAHLILPGVWLQTSDGTSAGLSASDAHLLLIFVGIIALGSLVQVAVLAGVAIAALKAKKEATILLNDLHQKALPIIQKVQPILESVHKIIDDAAPKVKVVTENIVETSHTVRAKVKEFDATLTDANRRTRGQVTRIDGMVSSTLDAVGNIASTVHHSIRVPVREVSGVVNGLKAGLDVLVGRAKSFGVGGTGSARGYRGGGPVDIETGNSSSNPGYVRSPRSESNLPR